MIVINVNILLSHLHIWCVTQKGKREGVEYPCDQYEYAATTSYALKTHNQSLSEGVRYPCDQCEYAGTQFSALKPKQNKHVGARYPCAQCEYASVQLSGLRNHKQSRHEGVRYLCDL